MEDEHVETTEEESGGCLFVVVGFIVLSVGSLTVTALLGVMFRVFREIGGF